jgi:hypothetical protein
MRVGGVCYLKINGSLYTLGDGEFSYNVGALKREAKLSKSGVVGFIAKAQVPFCEGEIIHTKELDVSQLLNLEDATVTLELYNSKTFLLHNAWFAGEGDISDEGSIKVRFEGLKGELING